MDEVNAKVKTESKRIGERIKAGENPEAARAEVRELNEQAQSLRDEQREVGEAFDALVLRVPNPPHATTPVGACEDDNQITGVVGEPRSFDFAPLPHWEVGEKLGILDLERGTKISGSGFFVLRGAGARLERALISWFIDVHVNEFGYTEVMPPHIVNSAAMTGTGQLPKMAEDMYRIEGEDLWLIPTAEVPVTNLYAGEILEPAQLPMYLCAHTPCFRREAGSYGKDVRGITRVHQFNKVEMVKFVRPEGGRMTSWRRCAGRRSCCCSDWSCPTASCCCVRPTSASRRRSASTWKCTRRGWTAGWRSARVRISRTSRRGGRGSATGPRRARSRSSCIR